MEVNIEYKYTYQYSREGMVYTNTKYSRIPPEDKHLVLTAIRLYFSGAVITDICEYRKADANGRTILETNNPNNQ